MHAPGCEAIFVGHCHCGMAGMDVDDLERTMHARGMPAETQEPEENVRHVVGIIRASPLLHDVPVHGLVFDPTSGRLDLLARSDQVPRAP